MFNVKVTPGQMLPHRAWVDLGVMVIKQYSTFSKLQYCSLTIRFFNVISRTQVEGRGVNHQQRCSRCILTLQPTGYYEDESIFCNILVTWCTICLLWILLSSLVKLAWYSLSDTPSDTRWICLYGFVDNLEIHVFLPTWPSRLSGYFQPGRNFLNHPITTTALSPFGQQMFLVACAAPLWSSSKSFGLVCWVLWHINLCRLLKAKSM